MVQDMNQIKGCRATGYPFIFGFTVYESFEGDAVKSSGHATMPAWGERPIGGHAGVAVGGADERPRVCVRHPLGPGRGLVGSISRPPLHPVSHRRSFWML